jgi:hypothetical protein
MLAVSSEEALNSSKVGLMVRAPSQKQGRAGVQHWKPFGTAKVDGREVEILNLGVSCSFKMPVLLKFQLVKLFRSLPS